MTVRVLRPVRPAPLISAEVFDRNFAAELSPDIHVEEVPLIEWCDTLLGPVARLHSDVRAADRFRSALNGFDFLCPSYELIPLAPLLLRLRNRSRSPARLWLVAHAPGAYALQWALLAPLLRAGDVIVAPTENARQTIEFLCPDLAPFVAVSPHPIPPLHSDARREPGLLVSLTRLHPSKLLHRQIDAMAVLRDRGHTELRMEIAGPLDAEGQTLSYGRSLRARIARLGLDSTVTLVGEIRGQRSKAAFLGRASLLVNLSVSVEESFGKSIVEAMCLGVPVLTTRWNGLPETLGRGGLAVPVVRNRSHLAVDVPARRVADAVLKLLAAPPDPDVCRTEAIRSRPDIVRARYRALLTKRERKGTRPLFSARGLLDATAPLAGTDAETLFAWHVADAARIRRRWIGETPEGSTDGERLDALVRIGLRAPLESWLGGLDDRWLRRPTHGATAASRLAGLAFASSPEEDKQALRTLAALKDPFYQDAREYFRVEILRRRQDHAAAFRLVASARPRFSGDELAWHRLVQLARLCREWQQPARALPALTHWLGKFPDSPDSGLVWLELCVTALEAGPRYRTDAARALDQAVALLGESPATTTLRDNIRS